MMQLQGKKYLKSGMGKRYLKNRLKRYLSLKGFGEENGEEEDD
jgi:hypothetical protein